MSLPSASPTTLNPAPAMSAADRAAHDAGTHYRTTEALPPAALHALARLERALPAKAAA